MICLTIYLLLILPYNVLGTIPVCQFASLGKCLGEIRGSVFTGYIKPDAELISTHNNINFKSCREFCDLNIKCYMATLDRNTQQCQLFENISSVEDIDSPFHIYIWHCCNKSEVVPNHCAGFWNLSLSHVSDNRERRLDPLIVFTNTNQYQCMEKCLANGVCGAINVDSNNVKSICQLISRVPVEDFYILKNDSMKTYQWACASNYIIPEPPKRCVPRHQLHREGYWKIENTSKVPGNDIEHLIEFYTLDYQKCLDNCALYRDCIRAWYSLSGFFCLLEASNRSSCKDHSSNSKYTFTTFVWHNCDNNQFFTINNIDFSLNDCRTLENTEGVFIYPIKCGYTPINVSKLYSCSDNNSGRDGITFSYSLQCQKNQSFRVLNRVVTSMFGFKNAILYRIFTGYESFWLVNVTDQKFKVDKRINRCKVFDSSMDVSGMNKLKIVKRTEWFAPKPYAPEIPYPSQAVPFLIIIETKNPACNCFSFEACSSILRSMDIDDRPIFYSLPYNFIVTGDGVAYEARGWDLESQVATAEYNSISFSIALCGTYNHTPNLKSLSSVKQLIVKAVKLNKILNNYSLYLYNDLFNRSYPHVGLRRVIALWPHYRGHIRPDCRPITSLGLIINIVSCTVCLLVIIFIVDRLISKIWHKSQCCSFRRCRIDTIYSNLCSNTIEILPKIAMHTMNDLDLDMKYLSPFFSPVHWIEDSQTIMSQRSTSDTCSCRSAIFVIIDLCRVQNKLVNIGSFKFLPEIQRCPRKIGFVFQCQEKLGDECLVILHFSNKNLFYKCIANLHQFKCVCYNNTLIQYSFTMTHDFTRFNYLRKSINMSRDNQIKRNDLQAKYTYAIRSDSVVINF